MKVKCFWKQMVAVGCFSVMLWGHLSLFHPIQSAAAGVPRFDMYGLKADLAMQGNDCYSYMHSVSQFYTDTSTSEYFTSQEVMNSLKAANMFAVCTHGKYFDTDDSKQASMIYCYKDDTYDSRSYVISCSSSQYPMNRPGLGAYIGDCKPGELSQLKLAFFGACESSELAKWVTTYSSAMCTSLGSTGHPDAPRERILMINFFNCFRYGSTVREALNSAQRAVYDLYGGYEDEDLNDPCTEIYGNPYKTYSQVCSSV